MLNKIKQTIQRFGLIQPGDRVVVAVSGGADSVCLLKVLTLLAEVYGLELSVAHLNHGLRGDEAMRDQLFVEHLCCKMGIPFDCRVLDIASLPKNGRSLEEVCRDERYGFLKDVLKQRGFNKVALGHHADDQVETMWLNLLRGSGAAGLKGFLPCRDGIYIRPLFEVSRQEILTFVHTHSLAFVEDSSNRESVFLRNRIRGELIPLIETAFNPRIREGMLHLSDILRDENDFMTRVVEGVLRDSVDERAEEGRIEISRLMAQHPAIQKRIVKHLLAKLAPEGRGVQYRHVLDVLKLVRLGGPSDHLDLGGFLQARRQYDLLIVSRRLELLNRELKTPKETDFSYEVTLPGVVTVKEVGLRFRFDLVESALPPRAGIVLIDYDRIELPLTVRNIKAGDRIQVYRDGGTKKISDLLIDRKVPKGQRRLIPLVADQNDIVWIAGVRLSEKVRVGAASRRAIRAEII